MKTIVEINSTNYASTGNIMFNIASEARKQGFNVYTCFKASKESNKHLNNENEIIIGNRYERILSSYLAQITGLRDHFNIFGTLAFVRRLKEIKPDIVHLHTLHDDFINTKILFKYFKESSAQVIWTFHDCNAFTGKCPYFDIVNCNKWQTICFDCPQQHLHPNSYIFDTSKRIYKERKITFTSISNLTIVTPSNWLNDIVHKSFFKNYNILTINNGIDLNVFKPIDSNFKEKYNITNKTVILGVANIWNERKGLDVFIKLANMLDDSYQIVLVGTNDNIDILLPKNIISIHRTYNQKELAEIYSAADLFVNPTREENFPTVNIESLACGTPILTFNTGGSTEIIDSTCGDYVDKNDVDSLFNKINLIIKNKPFSKESCINQSKQFNAIDKFKQYIELYKELS